jgi:hypothetical protein
MMIRSHHAPLLLLAFLASACSNPEQRARNVVTAYKTAVQQNDIPTVTKLADPNMRALIERNTMRQETVNEFLDAIVQHPVRVVRAKQGVVYIGWVPIPAGYQLEQAILAPVVIGEGRSISKYSALRESTGTNETNDWQVSVMGGEWVLAVVRATSERAPIEAALTKIDDALLRAWYFEGSLDAKHEIERQLETK